MQGFTALPGRRAESRLYTWGALLALLVVFAGFARTFYLKTIFGTPALSGLLFTHGVLMSLWFALFFTQGWLVAKGRTDLHRRLGVGGVVLALLIVGVSVATAIDAGRRGAAPAEGVPPLVFMAIPMADVLVFAILLGVGLWLRRRTDYHKRLMLLATLSILTPGIARFPLPGWGSGGLPLFFGLTILVVVVCVAIDTFRHRRLHPAFGWGGAFVIVMVPMRLVVAGTPMWSQFAGWLIS